MEKLLILIIVFTAIFFLLRKVKGTLKNTSAKTCACSSGGKCSGSCACHNKKVPSDNNKKEISDKPILEQV